MRFLTAYTMWGMGHNTVGQILIILAYAITDILTIIGAITVIRWWIHRKLDKKK